jgi:hypothetical protein
MRRYLVASLVILAAGTGVFWWLCGGFGATGGDFFGWARALRLLGLKSLIAYLGTVVVLLLARPARLSAALATALGATALSLGLVTLYQQAHAGDRPGDDASMLYPLLTVQLIILLLWTAGIRRNPWFNPEGAAHARAAHGQGETQSVE